MSPPRLVAAAGAVVLRRRGGATEVLLVHRPKYDDWSFPKGKLDPGEDSRTAAVREVLEETGVAIRLGPPLAPQTYVFGPRRVRTKVVSYWVGRARADDDVSAYAPNAEIDEVRWVEVDKAFATLSYGYDRDTLTEALPFARRTHALLVVRHAQAYTRRRWRGSDEERILTKVGERQSARLLPTLRAYGVDALVSSSSTRCWATLAPYADDAGVQIEVTDVLAEPRATPEDVVDEVDWALDQRRTIAVCSHRPVLPWVFDALGIDPPPLDPAAVLVVHHRKSRIAALERIAAPPAR